MKPIQVILLAAACGLTAQFSQAAAIKPNLIVIQTDEHNFRTLGCYRALMKPEQVRLWGKDAVVETPHVDWLAGQGAICERFYASSPVCTPSRASFVSGRHSHNTGSYRNDLPMKDEIETFAEVLKRNGYATGYAGKWHLDGPPKPGWAPARQFGFADNRYMFNRGHWKRLAEDASGPKVNAVDDKGTPTYAVEGADEKTFTTDFLADRTVDFIKANREQPFCYMVSIPDPHGPNTVRPPYDTMYAHLKFSDPESMHKPGEDLPSWAKPNIKGLENMPRYYGMVKCIDDNVGKIIQALKANGVLDRTIVVFTSDHGDMCGEHGRVNKGIPMEASAKVPFILAYPGKVKAGTVIHEALASVDFKQTILGLMGFQGSAADEGRDASALFLNGQAPAGWRDVAISRNSGGSWLMAVSSRYKFVVSAGDNPCLFDLQGDPLEMKNIFKQPAAREIVRELGCALADYGKKYREPVMAEASFLADIQWAAEGTGPYVAPDRKAGAGLAADEGEEGAGGKANKAGKKAGKKAKAAAK